MQACHHSSEEVRFSSQEVRRYFLRKASLANQSTWERGRKIGKSPKVVRRGRKRSLDHGSETPLAPVQPGVAPVQKQGCTWCKTGVHMVVQETLGRPCAVQEAFRSLGPKDLSYFRPLSQALWFAELVTIFRKLVAIIVNVNSPALILSKNSGVFLS